MPNQLMSRALAFSLGLVVVLVTLEMGSRGVIRIKQEYRQSVSDRLTDSKYPNGRLSLPKEAVAIEVLAIGESTTAAHFVNGEDVSWPKQAESLSLRKRQSDAISFELKIHNLASSGINSAVLVERLESGLQSRSWGDGPKYVIAMMGINDGHAMIVNHSWVYRKSVVARFLYWAYVSWRCPSCYRISLQQTEAPLIDPRHDKALDFLNLLESKTVDVLRDMSVLEELELKLEDELISSSEQGVGIALAWGNWAYQLSLRPAFSSLEYDFRSTRMIGPWRPEVARYAHFMSFTARLFMRFQQQLISNREAIPIACLTYMAAFPDGKAECGKLLLGALRAGTDFTPDLMRMALDAGIEGSPEVREQFHWNGVEVIRGNDSPQVTALTNSYRRVLKLSREYNFRVLAMQYPTMPLRKLREVLRDAGAEQDEVVFISNENFNLVVNDKNRSEFFDDLFGLQFGYPFGHATRKGNSVIAENVVQAIAEVSER
jgi:hypothetical protein